MTSSVIDTASEVVTLINVFTCDPEQVAFTGWRQSTTPEGLRTP